MVVSWVWHLQHRPGVGSWPLLLFLLGYRVFLTEAFSVTTRQPTVRVNNGESADLFCEYTADFGTPRVEWKFKNREGSLGFVYYSNQVTTPYKDRVVFNSGSLHFQETVPGDSGNYTCNVASEGGTHTGDVVIHLVVQVPPSIPRASVPTSVTTGSTVQLRCSESVGYPPSTFQWFQDNKLMPNNPKSNQAFQNSSYTINPTTGVLTFSPVAKSDSGKYVCKADNGVGPGKSSEPPVQMEVYDTNVGGIVAGVIVALLIVAFVGIGLWFAYRKGYIGHKQQTKPKVIYSQSRGDEVDDNDFKQKSSFVV